MEPPLRDSREVFSRPLNVPTSSLLEAPYHPARGWFRATFFESIRAPRRKSRDRNSLRITCCNARVYLGVDTF